MPQRQCAGDLTCFDPRYFDGNRNGGPWTLPFWLRWCFGFALIIYVACGWHNRNYNAIHHAAQPPNLHGKPLSLSIPHLSTGLSRPLLATPGVATDLPELSFVSISRTPQLNRGRPRSLHSKRSSTFGPFATTGHGRDAWRLGGAMLLAVAGGAWAMGPRQRASQRSVVGPLPAKGASKRYVCS